MYRENPGHLLNSYIYRNWDFIHLTRQYLNNIIFTLFSDRYYAEKVANAASELLSTAYKKSPQESDLNITLSEVEDKIIFKIRTHVNEHAEEVFNKVKAEIDSVYTIEDPKAAFKQAILEYLEKNKDDDSLNYARIRLETNAEISVELNDDGSVTEVVTFPRE